MNSKLSLFLTAFLLICSSIGLSYSYVISETEKIDEILINSFLETKPLDTNELSAESSLKSFKSFEENQTISTTLLKSSPNKKSNPKLKTCYFCTKEKQLESLKEEQQKERLELIKHQILSKLGLSEAPKLLNKEQDTSKCK